MKHYNILQALILSFFSKYLYRDVLENWRGIGFSLLFLSTLILTACSIFSVNQFVQSYANEALPVITDGMPEMEVKDGRLYVEGDQEFRFESAEAGTPESFLLIINPKDPNFAPKPNQATILLDDYEFAVYQADGRTNTESWSDFDDWQLDREALLKFSQKNAWLVPWFLAPVILVALYIFYIFIALCWGFITWINSRLFRLAIDYAEGVRIAVAAMTPAIILISLNQFLALPFINFFSGFLITYVYILVALYWISKGIDEQAEE